MITEVLLYWQKNLDFHAITKPIKVHYHYVHEKVIEGVIDLKYIKIGNQIMDVHTKALPKIDSSNFKTSLDAVE